MFGLKNSVFPLFFGAIFASVTANAQNFAVPSGDLGSALQAYVKQSGVTVIYSPQAVAGRTSHGVSGPVSPEQALARILSGTGLTEYRTPQGDIGIIHDTSSENDLIEPVRLAQAVPARAAVETVTVTSSKLGGADVQSIPIAITALSQEQLTSTQTAGGPDLVKQVPNLTFTKTNFTGYSIQIRGIGTQAISVTTDPAVAVAFNDIPFIRNHFFEQEFYDVSNVEVLRGPQGTLYGRNATAGVVNLISAKPTDTYEAMASIDVGNYNNRRLEGMLNIPIIGDQLDIRAAGEWTKRDGYAYNEQLQQNIDGRDLWSSRISLAIHPIEQLSANLVWEHFNEDDNRARSTKQLCTRSNSPAVVDGPAGPQTPSADEAAWLTQGCVPGSLYSPTAFETPNAGAIPFIAAGYEFGVISTGIDVYGGLLQSPDLRTVSSALNPKYKARNDTVEFNADYNISPTLTLTSQTGYNKDFLYSTEDYNRFNTSPGLFRDLAPNFGGTFVGQDYQYCDPQLGCSARVVGQDISQERAEQYSQELRLASKFSGKFNFSLGGNYLHYDTLEDYYVFFNAISLLTETISNSARGLGTLGQGVIATGTAAMLPGDAPHIAFDPVAANACGPVAADPTLFRYTFASTGLGCSYIDPNPLDQIDGQGHNYFRSQNPYRLNSWAGFGEVYYQLTPEIKLTGGLRWTDDRKRFVDIPSWVLFFGKGYLTSGIVKQEWKEWTGRVNGTWTPKLDFTDQSLFYASYGHGYKGGGANPPGVEPITIGFGTSPSDLTHPLTFKPEFIDAFELGSKNALLDGNLTVNGDIFYYNYENYQISQIVDRTSINLNFDAHVKGAELEATWEPVPGLRFNFSGGYENAVLAKGSQAIDLMDRTAGQPGWMVVKPYVTETSNCILPSYVVNESLTMSNIAFLCLSAYSRHNDPITSQTYVANPNPARYPGYIGFDPTNPIINNGEGFVKDLSGNQLPNSPPFTLSLGAQYTLPVSPDWAATGRVDGYWQGNSFARVFNDKPYDQLHGYTNVNLTLIFTNQDGWQAMAYLKNVFDTTAITGAFLNSDDTALTTNVFVTDPRLFGLRLTKNW